MNFSEKSQIWREASKTFLRSQSDGRGYGNNYIRQYKLLEKFSPLIRRVCERVTKGIWRLYRILLAVLSFIEGGDRTIYKKYRFDLGVDIRKSMEIYLPDLLKGYEKYLNDNGQFLSYSSARTFYYYSVFHEEIKKNSSIIEIGAGYGNLAELILNQHDVAKYVIVDLPEVLEFSKNRLRVLFPEIKVFETIEESRKCSDKHILFVQADTSDKLLDDKFDVAINTESFAEMYTHVSNQYFDLVSKILKPGGVFVSINRFLRVIGEEPALMSNVTSPFLNNIKDLKIESISIDKFRAMFPIFRSEPNLVIIYKNDR